jgi:hypothetical protein
MERHGCTRKRKNFGINKGRAEKGGAMRYCVCFMVFIFLFIDAASAKSSFVVKDASRTYNVEVVLDKCDNDLCRGKASVKLLDKTTEQVVQQFESDDFYVSSDMTKNSLLQSPSSPAELHQDDISQTVIFGDFNFDGYEDVAIADEERAYNVYVYNISRKKFIHSEELSALTTEYGMFIVDEKRKRLEVMTAKIGCCLHAYTEYSVIPKKGLVEVSNREEEVKSTSKGNRLVVTTNDLVSGRWVRNVKTYKMDDARKKD